MSTSLLNSIAELFPGFYQNDQQRRDEAARGVLAPHGALVARVSAIDAPAFGPDSFLVRGYQDPTGLPYMARIYAFTEGGTRLEVHSFDGDPRLAGGSLPAGLVRGAHSSDCDLAVSSRRGSVICRTDPERCRKIGLDGREMAEDYRLSFDGTHMHVLRVEIIRDGGPTSRRRDRVPYRLLRIAGGPDQRSEGC